MKAVSMFTSAGIGETRLDEIGVSVLVACELLEERCKIFEQLNNAAEIVHGDISNNAVFEAFIKKAKAVKPELLLATPPCQGVSIAGKNRSEKSKSEDPRNLLIFQVIEAISRIKPKFVLIENVPQYLDLQVEHNGSFFDIPGLLKLFFSKEYFIEMHVLNAADYGVAQNRRRAMIRLWEKSADWPLPEKIKNKVTVRDAIGDLPSIEAGEISPTPWHFARDHIKRQIECMRHTPTGQTAFENAVHFPRKADGTRVKAYDTTYRRMNWDQPAPAITMRNDAISSQANVHPGRKNKDGTYSDARVLTPLELMKINSIKPEHFDNVKIEERVFRQILGESIPPLLLNSVLRGISDVTS